MNRHKIAAVFFTAGVCCAVLAHGTFLAVDFDNTTNKKTNITTSLIPQKEDAGCGIGKEHINFEVAIKSVRDKVAKAHKSKSIPRQCLSCSEVFELNGYEFAVRTVTNQSSVMNRPASEGDKARNLLVGGPAEIRIDITRIGGGAWDACLYANYRREDAIEIAIGNFFSRSSMTEKRIAESIAVNTDKMGDVCLSWRQESRRNTLIVFIKGGCVVVVRGCIDVEPVAALLDCILCECGRAYEKGEVITIKEGAARLSENHHAVADMRGVAVDPTKKLLQKGKNKVTTDEEL